MSGMLAPVGIGITGALLIVGALYSIRMIHRKRRNSFKHQRRKVRQPEVNTLPVFITFMLLNTLLSRVIATTMDFVLHRGSQIHFISVSSNPERPAPATRIRPCCWPTAQRMNSDEFCLSMTNVQHSRKGGSADSPLLGLLHLQSPRAVWL